MTMSRVFTQSLVVVALASATAAAQQAQPARTQPSRASPTAAGAEAAAPAIDPRAAQIMRGMSTYLSGLQSFRFNSTAIDEVVARSGEKVQQISESRVAVRRPNAVRSERVGPATDIQFRYDGHNFNVFGNRTGFYATVPAPMTIDGAVDALRDQYGIDVPAADLLLSRPYEAMMRDVRSGQYIGLEPIDGVPTHHLAFRERDFDWQIWIQDGAQPLPRRLVITSTNEQSQPQFTAELSGWEPNAALAPEDFAFRPPPGARRIELLPASAPSPNERQGR